MRCGVLRRAGAQCENTIGLQSRTLDFLDFFDWFSGRVRFAWLSAQAMVQTIDGATRAGAGTGVSVGWGIGAAVDGFRGVHLRGFLQGSGSRVLCGRRKGREATV